MAAATAAGLLLCARTARATRDATWILLACALGVFLGSMVLRIWPGAIDGDRATALRLMSTATAAIAATGVARRLRGGITVEVALDIVPVAMAVSAMSLLQQPGQSPFDGVVMHFVYPATYAALLLLASELLLRRHGRADLLAGAGMVGVAAAAMLVTAGLRATIDWPVTLPDGMRSLGFLLAGAGAWFGMAERGAERPASEMTGPRPSFVPALAVVTLIAVAVGSNGTLYPLCVIAFAAFVLRLHLDRRRARRLVGDLALAEARYRGLVDQLPMIVYEDAYDEFSSAQFVSAQTSEILGYTPEEWLADREMFVKLLHPDDRDRVRREMMETPQADVGTTEFRLIAKDGRVVWINDHSVLVRGDNGEPTHWHGLMEDITARKQAELEMRESERRFREILERVQLMAVMLDRDGRITFANDHLLALTGWTRDELTGRDWYDTFPPPSERHHRLQFDEAIATGVQSPAHETILLTRDGDELIVSCNETLLRDASGAVVGLTSIAEDITERRRAEERVQYLARYDELTGLPNRDLFTDWLDLAIERSGDGSRNAAVLYISLDNFSLVNDSLGHAAGDELLRQFAHRLRDAAFGAELVARQGGDEFLVLVADTGEGDGDGTHAIAEDVVQMAEALAGRLEHLLAIPFCYQGEDVYLTARAGVALYPRDGADRESVIREATVDRYRGRHGRRREVAPSKLPPTDELLLISRLHRALERREFVLHYQPFVDLHDGRPIGVEALIRWVAPGGEMASPATFIPVAERTGLIAPITEWVVSEICEQTLRWAEQGVELPISFNFPTGLWEAPLVERLLARIRAAGVDPRNLVMEVTESAAMGSPDETAEILEMLEEAGMPLAIDDFGTGHSSLSRLTEVPAATLKIDRSFVRDVPHDASSARLAATIVSLARGVGMEPLAEGIETEAQRRFLVENGCRVGQGYLFARPAPAAEIERLWREQRRAA